MGVLDNTATNYDADLHVEACNYVSSCLGDVPLEEPEEIRPYLYFEILRQLGEMMLRDGGLKFTREFFKDGFKEAAQNGDW